jgi:diadenosine tetraphosphate (Ap4A) HIT family hydrolase
MSTEAPHCHVCRTLAEPEPEQIVYDEGPWFAFLAANVPGWVMLATKEHVDGMWGLSPEAAAGLGPLLQRFGAAVKDVTGADRVHLVYLGENALHFHVGFFPRLPGEPALLENGRMVEEVETLADPDRARELGAAVRDSLHAARAG